MKIRGTAFMNEPKYKRVMLKISGEALSGDQGFGISTDTIGKISDKIKEVYCMGVPRKAIQIPRPTNSKGVALTTVSAIAFILPNAPLSRAWKAIRGFAPRKVIIIVPISRARRKAAKGIRLIDISRMFLYFIFPPFYFLPINRRIYK